MDIPKLSALFETSLASAMSAAATSFSLVSATDRDGNALSGLYGFIIDEGTAGEEFVLATISGATGTIVYRGIDSNDPNTEAANNKKLHRRGASVKITDYPIIGVLRQILNGEATIPNKLAYASAPTFTPGSNEVASVAYADELALAGAPNASTTTKGIVEEATDAELQAGTATGSTGARLAAGGASFSQNSANNKVPVSGSNGKLSSSWGGASNSLATLNASAKVVEDPANATATPTASKIPIADGSGDLDVGWIPHGTGADKIVKLDGAGKLPAIDGSQLTNVITYKNGVGSRSSGSTGAQTIAHGLGKTPKVVRIRMSAVDPTGNDTQYLSFGVYNGSTIATLLTTLVNGTSASQSTSTTSIGTAVADVSIAVDGTNITLTWNSITQNHVYTWEAEA